MINAGLSIDEYFRQKLNKNAKGLDKSDNLDEKKSKKRKIIEIEEEPIEVEQVPTLKEKSKKKKKSKYQNEQTNEINEALIEIEMEVTNKKKKKKRKDRENVDEEQSSEIKESNEQVSSEESVTKSPSIENGTKTVQTGKKRKNDEEPVEAIIENTKTETEEPVRGANAIYSKDIIQIPSHIANKMSNVLVTNFNNSNLGDIVGYGMHENIEIKVVQTKAGDKNLNSTDKYTLYNMDKMERTRVNPKKIFTKLKKTKKSIQVI